MNKVAILFGLMLIALGAVGYFGSTPQSKPATETAAVGVAGQSAAAEPAKRSLTAFIPAAFGVLLLICGAIGLQPEKRKQAMHIAAGIGLLGFVAGVARLGMKLPAILSGDPISNPRAVLFSGLMGLICLVYVIMSVRSFIAARQQSKLGGRSSK